MAIKHAKTSAAEDDGNTAHVQAADWNASHTIEDDTITPAMLHADTEALFDASGAADAVDAALTSHAASSTAHGIDTQIATHAANATAHGSFAAAVHTHTAGQVTGLATVATSGSAADLGTGTLPVARIGANALDGAKLFRGSTSGHVLTSNGAGADPTYQAPAGGGSDPWTYSRLASPFSTTLATPQAVTGLGFSPALNATYIVEGFFLLRTATATVGPRPGITWPTNLSDGAAQIDATNSAIARAMANGNPAAALNCASTGTPTTTGSWPGTLWATFVCSGTTGGTFQVTLQSETAGTAVTMRIGSWIRWRTI